MGLQIPGTMYVGLRGWRYCIGLLTVFATTLTKSAQQWFSQLGNGVITSFDMFVALFVHQFVSSRRQSWSNLSLYGMRQKENEPLRSYVKRFTTAALEVPEDCRNEIFTPRSQRKLRRIGMSCSNELPSMLTLRMPYDSRRWILRPKWIRRLMYLSMFE